MGRFDILVSDAEFNLQMAKKRQEVLNKWLEIACNTLDRAEKNYYDKSTAACNHEKIVRSLAAKLVWAKRKNRIYES